MTALLYTDKISQSLNLARKMNVKTVRFGSNYEQRVSIGTNSVSEQYSVTWDNLTATEYDALIAQFVGTKGVSYLTWTGPRGSTTKKFVIEPDSIQEQPKSGSLWTVQCTLRQVFDL